MNQPYYEYQVRLIKLMEEKNRVLLMKHNMMELTKGSPYEGMHYFTNADRQAIMDWTDISAEIVVDEMLEEYTGRLRWVHNVRFGADSCPFCAYQNFYGYPCIEIDAEDDQTCPYAAVHGFCSENGHWDILFDIVNEDLPFKLTTGRMLDILEGMP